MHHPANVIDAKDRFKTNLPQLQKIAGGEAETPESYFKKGTINIGNRQKGRLRAQSVIDCEPFTEDISEAINYLYTEEFLNKLKNIKHPYGNGGASLKIFIARVSSAHTGKHSST